MITGYFDDSGTGANDSVVAVAGYVGSVSQWQKFDQEWGKLLAQYSVSKMHRAELESGYGEFVGWTREKKNSFIAKAQEIIRKRTYLPIGMSVIKEEFEEVFPNSLKKVYGGAYGFCVILCLTRAKHWFDKVNHREPIDWVFEAGTAGSGQIAHLMNAMYSDSEMRQDLRINGWSFGGKNIQPLQAADIIAYEAFKHVTNQLVAQPRRDVRISFKHLMRSKDDEHLEHWSKDQMEDYVSHPTCQYFNQKFS
jgi:hypothetical protein